MINVAAGLNIGVGDGFSIKLDDKRCNPTHTLSPKQRIHRSRRPCLHLFQGVIIDRDTVNRGKKHLMQRGRIADPKVAD